MAVELYKHNAYAYEQIEEKLKTSNRTCVIHPTGSGKSFIAIKWLYENRNRNCLFLTSQKPIIDQIIRHIESCGLTLNDFPNLKFDLYQNITEQVAKTYSTDCIVLDEFHRCGAPEWGKGLDVLLNNNSNAKVLGFSATPIRYLDDCRNMTEELFDNNIASQITLVEAVAKGILPLPTYINALYSFDEDIQRIQKKINRLASESDRKLFQEKFDSAKRLLEKSEGLEKVFSKNITKSNGRFIVFCRDVEHMNRMIEESKNWFESVNDNIDIYSVISTNKDFDNRNSIESFETSNNDHLKLLFCVNMLNEGLHVNNIDGVIMLRPTISPIIYLQQLGRALSVGHNEHPLIFDIVNNSLGIKDIDKFYEQVKRQIQAGTNNPAISGYKDIDIGSFKVIDEMSSMIDLFDIIDKSLTKETYDNSKEKKLYDELIEYQKSQLYILDKAKDAIADYIASDASSLKEYVKSRDMSLSTLTYYLDILILCEDPLYETYKISALEKEEFEKTKQISNGVEVINKLQNGVLLEDGSIRDFDLIDYYEMMNIKPKAAVNLLKKYISNHQLVGLKIFSQRYLEDKELTPKDVSIKLNERLEINCQKDKRGIFVRGTGKVISDDEKLAVINYILNKRIPLTDGTYESGLARVKKNVFDLDKAESEKIYTLV